MNFVIIICILYKMFTKYWILLSIPDIFGLYGILDTIHRVLIVPYFITINNILGHHARNKKVSSCVGKLAKFLCSLILLSVKNENQSYLLREILVVKWVAVYSDRIAPSMQKSLGKPSLASMIFAVGLLYMLCHTVQVLLIPSCNF